MRFFISNSGLIVALILVSLLLINSNSFGQTVYGINDEIGGGGSGTAQVEKPDDSMLYIVGGTVIVGLIVYAIVSRSKEKKIEVDSTINETSSVDRDIVPLTLSIQEKTEQNLPLDVYLGMQRMSSFTNEKRYLLGVKIAL